LQADLAERLSSFVALQREGEWKQASDFLGDYYFTLGWKRAKYGPDQKRWMVAQLRSKAIVSFTPQQTIFSTDILNVPLKRKYWRVVGEGVFSRDGQTVHDKAGFLVYRERDEWFFVPLDVNENGMGLVIPPAATNN
jgi:hypothetical protein